MVDRGTLNMSFHRRFWQGSKIFQKPSEYETQAQRDHSRDIISISSARSKGSVKDADDFATGPPRNNGSTGLRGG
jgi:hypothetical protein